MYRHRLSIRPVEPYSLNLTVLSHGWVNLLPFSWDSSREILYRQEYVSQEDVTVAIEIRQKLSGHLAAKIATPSPLKKSSVLSLSRLIRRSLSTDVDLTRVRQIATNLDPAISELLESGGGRLLLGYSPFEDVVKTLFTTNASWGFTQKMTERLVEVCGKNRAFPTPEQVLFLNEQELRSKCRLGYRAKYLLDIARLFHKNGNPELLVKFAGLGSYGMAHVHMLSGDYRRVPIDSEVRSYSRNSLALESDSEIEEHFRPWGDYAFLGYKLGRIARNSNWIGDHGGTITNTLKRKSP